MVTSGDELKSQRILREIQQQQGRREIVDIEEEQVKVVIFVCGGRKYGFYGREVREILPPCEIAWVPGLPAYLPGLINVRGDVESIIDLGLVMGYETAAPATSLIAMAVRGDFRSGVLINTVEEVVDIPVSAIKPLLATINGSTGGLLAGEFEYGGELIALIDMEKLAGQISVGT